MQLFLFKYYKVKIYKGKVLEEETSLYYDLNLFILISQLKQVFKHFSFNKYKINTLINRLFSKDKKNKILKKIYTIPQEESFLKDEITDKKDIKLENVKIKYTSKLLLNYLNKIAIDINYKTNRNKIKLNNNKVDNHNKNLLDQINVNVLFFNLQLKKFCLLNKVNNFKNKKCLKPASLAISWPTTMFIYKKLTKMACKQDMVFKSKKKILNFKQKTMPKFNFKKIKNKLVWEYYSDLKINKKLFVINKEQNEFNNYNQLNLITKLNIEKEDYLIKSNENFVDESNENLNIYEYYSFKFIVKLKFFFFFKNQVYYKNLNSNSTFPKKLYNNVHKKINIIKKSTILNFSLLTKRKVISNEITNFIKFNKELYNYKKINAITKKNDNTNYYINISRLLNYYKTKKNITIIFNCMYLNKYVFDHYSINILIKNRNLITKNKSFLYKNLFNFTDSDWEKNESNHYKLKKELDITTEVFEKTKKTYFFNSWRGLLVTWKQARIFHWSMYKQGTLKKKRYRKFLPPFIKVNKVKADIIIKHFSFKFQFSTLFWKNFTNMYLFFFNKSLVFKEILQIPINILFWIFLKNYREEKYKIKKKIESWLQRVIRIKKTFWMETKKKTPKFFSRQSLSFKNVNNAIQYDFITNYFCVVKSSKVYEKTNDYVFNNKMLKMHKFRFKS